MSTIPVNLLNIFQIVADVIILALILFYFVKRKEDRNRDKILEVRAREMLQLNKSMDTLIKEAKKTTEEMLSVIDSKQSELQNLLNSIEKKQEEAARIQYRPDHSPPPAPEEEKADGPIEEVEADKYAEAARLAEEGVAPDEIARLVNLSRGEVELILDLKK